MWDFRAQYRIELLWKKICVGVWKKHLMWYKYTSYHLSDSKRTNLWARNDFNFSTRHIKMLEKSLKLEHFNWIPYPTLNRILQNRTGFMKVLMLMKLCPNKIQENIVRQKNTPKILKPLRNEISINKRQAT